MMERVAAIIFNQPPDHHCHWRPNKQTRTKVRISPEWSGERWVVLLVPPWAHGCLSRHASNLEPLYSSRLKEEKKNRSASVARLMAMKGHDDGHEWTMWLFAQGTLQLEPYHLASRCQIALITLVIFAHRPQATRVWLTFNIRVRSVQVKGWITKPSRANTPQPGYVTLAHSKHRKLVAKTKTKLVSWLAKRTEWTSLQSSFQGTRANKQTNRRKRVYKRISMTARGDNGHSGRESDTIGQWIRSIRNWLQCSAIELPAKRGPWKRGALDTWMALSTVPTKTLRAIGLGQQALTFPLLRLRGIFVF